jgi:hypothetical protein
VNIYAFSYRIYVVCPGPIKWFSSFCKFVSNRHSVNYGANRERSFFHGIPEVLLLSLTLSQTNTYLKYSKCNLLHLDLDTNASLNAFLLWLHWILDVNKRIYSLKINIVPNFARHDTTIQAAFI